jgi:hypothetical protein
VFASAALGKLQSANIFGDSTGDILQICTSSSDLTSDGEQKPNTRRLYHSPGDSIVQDPGASKFTSDSTAEESRFQSLDDTSR